MGMIDLLQNRKRVKGIVCKFALHFACYRNGGYQYGYRYHFATGGFGEILRQRGEPCAGGGSHEFASVAREVYGDCGAFGFGKIDAAAFNRRFGQTGRGACDH